MFRKAVLAAMIALGAAALTPTTASAHGRGWHGHFGHHYVRGAWGPRFHAAPAYVGYYPCLRKRWMATPWGMRLRTVNICY